MTYNGDNGATQVEINLQKSQIQEVLVRIVGVLEGGTWTTMAAGRAAMVTTMAAATTMATTTTTVVVASKEE